MDKKAYTFCPFCGSTKFYYEFTRKTGQMNNLSEIECEYCSEISEKIISVKDIALNDYPRINKDYLLKQILLLKVRGYEFENSKLIIDLLKEKSDVEYYEKKIRCIERKKKDLMSDNRPCTYELKNLNNVLAMNKRIYEISLSRVEQLKKELKEK